MMDESNKQFRAEGSVYMEVNINPLLNKLRGKRKGSNKFTFKNNDVIECHTSTMEIKGVIFGELVMNFVDKYLLIDHNNQILCEVIYNPEYNKKSNVAKLTSSFKSLLSYNNNIRSDQIEINIYSFEYDHNSNIIK